MPMQRRIPKRGFVSKNRTLYREIKVGDLARVSNETIDPADIRAAGLCKGRGPIVLLGGGEIDRAVKVSVHRASRSAVEKITSAGGSIEILELDPVDRRVKKGPKPKTKKAKAAKPTVKLDDQS